MSEYYHIVPWYNSSEWHDVYDNLYSKASSLITKQHALNTLTMWKARCPLPSGVESTLCLLEVYIQDLTSSVDTSNEHVLRLAYSSAIMRFVNHMLESVTVKGKSLYHAARKLGVPDWIVDLRHDTAHNNKLPSIELLREASFIGLQWLKIHYWHKYKRCIKDYVSGQIDIEEKISIMMNLYTSLSFCAHSEIENLDDLPSLMRESILNDAGEFIESEEKLSQLKTVSSLINVLSDYSKKLMKNKKDACQINKVLLGDDSVILSLEVLNSLSSEEFEKKTLNRHYIQCFQLLLTILHSNDLLLDFLLELIKVTQSDDSSTKPLLAALWVSEILIALKNLKKFIEKVEITSLDDSQDLKQLQLHYYHWFPNEKTTSLLLDLRKPVPYELTNISFIQPIISMYNPYLTYFIKDLLYLIEPQLPEPATIRICKLAKVISSSKICPMTDIKIYTVEDIKSKLKSKLVNKNDAEMECCDSDSDCVEITDVSPKKGISEKSTQKMEIDYTSFWKLSSISRNWAQCPIGQLIMATK